MLVLVGAGTVGATSAVGGSVGVGRAVEIGCTVGAAPADGRLTTGTLGATNTSRPNQPSAAPATRVKIISVMFVERWCIVFDCIPRR